MVAAGFNAPLVSVVMAVKNGGVIVREAIDSVLNQTFVDFEFIIINDGSTDETLEVLESYTDPRIQIFSQENQGLARTLNRGLCLATGKYIARQDHDDISLSARLQMQVDYMESHPQCGLLGTAAEIRNEDASNIRYHRHPTSSSTLKFELIFNNPFVHTSWMIRSDVISKVGYYSIDPAREPPEDYEYVSRVAREFDVANLPDVLVIYREFPDSLSSEIRPNSANKIQTFRSKLALISAENIAFWNCLPLDNQRALNFGALLHGVGIYNLEGSRFLGFKKLINSAAKKVFKDAKCKSNNKLVRDKIDSLRYQYLTSKHITLTEKVWDAASADGFLFAIRLFKNRILRRVYERVTGPGPRRQQVITLIKSIFKQRT